ncbi:MAG: LPS export ABC transporter periplasmic protein LptC [Thiohalocapsa sp.]
MASSALRAPRISEPGTEPEMPAVEAWDGAGWDAAAWQATLWPGEMPEERSEARHARRVALLRRVLPAIGVALLLLVALWPRLAPLWDRMRFALPAIDLRAARELRMVNPRYAGLDRRGRPFMVTAAAGRQVPGRQDLMSLEAPRADLKTHAGAAIAVDAATGVYQAQAQLLDLFGRVTLAHQNGDRLVTTRARIDIAHNSAEGGDPVSGRGPSGELKAEGFKILDKGDIIILSGHAQLRLRQAKVGSEQAAPPTLPAPVARIAAPVVVAAAPRAHAPRSVGPAAAHRAHPVAHHAAAARHIAHRAH